MMNLNHLAIFHAVTQARSVSGAAERLLISQPAISKQLGQLEKSLGIRLFDRLPRGVRPTEAGELLSNYASRLFALADEGERAIAELRGLQRGRLRVGAGTTVGVYLLPDLFVRFRAAHPGIHLELEIAPSDVLARRLLEGSIDIAVTEGAIDHESLQATPILNDRLIAIAPCHHPLSRKRRLTTAMLCREPFIVRETGSGTQSLVERELSRRGLAVKAAMSFSNTEAIKRAVISGVGVAIVSSLSVGLEIQAKKLAILPIADLEISRPIYRVTHKGAYASKSALAFIAMLDALEGPHRE